jgi:hypothetical protein
MSFATGVLVLALLGIDSVGGVVAFAILYGFFSGGGLPFLFCAYTTEVKMLIAAVLSLSAPLMARFIRDESEIGWVAATPYHDMGH